ncbi:TPA: adhesin, partial [Salmonella enterica]|nr:adhesin [Salmonella enterica]
EKTLSHDLVVNSFDVDEIAGLPHPVCTLSLAENNEKYYYNYVEGGICPVGGESCTYSAIMKLNGKITILKQASLKNNTSVFKNDDISITTTQKPTKESEADEEGCDVDAVIIIKTKNSEIKLNMSGYCGI